MSLGTYRVQRNWGSRVHEMNYLGMKLITLENDLLRIGVLAGKGSDVVELNYKPKDIDLVWLTAGGVRNPTSYLSSSPDSLATFLDYYLGGWQEIFPNGGEPSSFGGAQFGQHGEVCNLPWDVTVDEDTERSVAVSFSVRTQKTPFFVEKQMRIETGNPTLAIAETVTNESPAPLRAMWGHHITFGRPFLDDTCKIRIPDGVKMIPHNEAISAAGRRVRPDQRPVWPIAEGVDGKPVDFSVLPPKGTNSELLFLTEFPEGWYEVEHPGKGLIVRVEWDIETMPYLWYWQEYGATDGYPWYGRHYNIGLEPGSSYPNAGLAEAVANGSALTIGPGETQSFWLRYLVNQSGAD